MLSYAIQQIWFKTCVNLSQDGQKTCKCAYSEVSVLASNQILPPWHNKGIEVSHVSVQLI